jgi:hypothetical protein
VAVVKTTRLNLAKQAAGDPSWNVGTDQGFDDADARFLKVSDDYGDAADPNVAPKDGDYIGQKYVDVESDPPRIWTCTDATPSASVWKLISTEGIKAPVAIGGNTILDDILNALDALKFTTGDVKLTLKASADTGWVLMDDGTIGDAGSGGTTRANADCEDLFTLLWDNIIDTWCPVTPSPRGASAAADWAAGKTIKLPLTLGRALGVSGAGSGLTTRALGENLGAETHQHTGTTGGPSSNMQNVNEGGSNVATSVHTHSFTSAAASSMPPESFLNVMIKL